MVRHGQLAVYLAGLTNKQRNYLNKFLRRNPDLIKRQEEVFIVENNGLGVVKLLRLINYLGEDRVLRVAPLAEDVYRWPEEYKKLAQKRKLGRHETAQLYIRQGVELSV